MTLVEKYTGDLFTLKYEVKTPSEYPILARSGGRIVDTALAVLLTVSITLGAQQAEVKDRKSVVAIFTDSEITIDGELNEPAWQTAQPATDFVQRAPAEGQPASHPSVVRVLYDKEYLYIGAYLYDSRPDLIVVNDITRDSRPALQDAFGVVLDTFRDRRNGYNLSVSPLGAKRDTQFFNEGWDANRNWDAVWHIETRIQEDGWTAEYAIPFKSLRFTHDDIQVWGVQFFRAIRRLNESNSWMPIPSRFRNYSQRISYGGDLHGLQGVQPGKDLKVKPYVRGGGNHFASRGQGTKADLDGGADVKYGLTSGLTLDLTVNTDFSQVEADTQQVNLTRFPLFFPEKREFFLENTGNFRFEAAGNNQALLFHSRRIGLAKGLPVPILAGVRVSGRSGPYYLGLMNIQTRSDRDIPANNFTVTRVRRNILANSDVGAIFLNRQSRLPDDYNRSYGADVNFLFFDQRLTASALLARTHTPGREGRDWLKSAETRWDDGLIRFTGYFLEIQANFNPEVGFVRRPGRKILHNEFGLRFFQGHDSYLSRYIREISPHLTSEQVILPGSITETKLLRPQFRVDFQDGSFFQVQYVQNFERLSEPFDIGDLTILSGDYHFNEYAVQYSSNNSAAVAANIGYRNGDFFNGAKRTLELGATFRPNYRLTTSMSYALNDIELPQGSLALHLVGLNLQYAFNPRAFVNVFLQYSNDTDKISSNIRFRLIHRPLSDLYVVYNAVQDRSGDLNDRELALKYTYLLDF